MSDQTHTPIGDVRRELMLRIVNGIMTERTHLITGPLYHLNETFPPKHLTKALVWLIEHNLVGENFINWYNNKCTYSIGSTAYADGCNGSNLELHRILLSVVQNTVIQKVIAGVNFKQ